MVDTVLVVAGLAALIGGAWLLVHEAVRLAVRLGLSPMVVGLTVVAFGTSAPELIVGASASAGARASWRSVACSARTWPTSDWCSAWRP